MTQKEKKTVSVLLPYDLYEALSLLAVQDHRSLSGEIRQILKNHIASL